MSGSAGQSWWRRNWWGFAAVVPLLAAVVVVSPSGAYEALKERYAGQADEVLSPGADGWTSYGDARLRLIELGPAELFDGEQQPFVVPGLAAWQVTLSVETGPDPKELLGCRLDLEDAAGRRYRDAPSVIGSARDETGSGVYAVNCTRDYDDEANPFETVAYFLLPESTEPVALLVSHHAYEPAYIRIELG